MRTIVHAFTIKAAGLAPPPSSGVAERERDGSRLWRWTRQALIPRPQVPTMSALTGSRSTHF